MNDKRFVFVRHIHPNDNAMAMTASIRATRTPRSFIYTKAKMCPDRSSMNALNMLWLFVVVVHEYNPLLLSLAATTTVQLDKGGERERWKINVEK